MQKRKSALKNYLLYCEKGVFNCKNVEIKSEVNGIFAYIKDQQTGTILEISSDKFEIYFNTRENLAYLINLQGQQNTGNDQKAQMIFLNEERLLRLCNESQKYKLAVI